MTRFAQMLANPTTRDLHITQRDELRPLNVTQLRKVWRDNDRAILQAFRSLDFHAIDSGTVYKHLVLMPEFDRRGYACTDDSGLALNQPRKVTR